MVLRAVQCTGEADRAPILCLECLKREKSLHCAAMDSLLDFFGYTPAYQLPVSH